MQFRRETEDGGFTQLCILCGTVLYRSRKAGRRPNTATPRVA